MWITEEQMSHSGDEAKRQTNVDAQLNIGVYNQVSTIHRHHLNSPKRPDWLNCYGLHQRKGKKPKYYYINLINDHWKTFVQTKY